MFQQNLMDCTLFTSGILLAPFEGNMIRAADSPRGTSALAGLSVFVSVQEPERNFASNNHSAPGLSVDDPTR